MNSNPFDEKKVPKYWIVCPFIGEIIQAGKYRFIPMKTPLGAKWCPALYSKHQFRPEQAAIEASKRGKRLRYIFSFPNTKDRWARYDEADLDVNVNGDQYSITQFHYRTPGEGPNQEIFEEFVNQLHSLELEDDEVVGIHCTHGFNRTGYIIVRYLVDEMHMDLVDALQTFRDHRSPGIYKKDYIQNLFDFYGLDNVWNTPEGTKQSWTFPDPDSLPHFVVTKPIKLDTNDAPVVGKPVSPHINTKLKYEMMRMCKKDVRNKQFPGSQPVTLLKNTESRLKDNPTYRATYKSDGTRYFMLCIEGQSYLVDRKLEFRQVNVRMVNRRGVPLQHTLLDGELVKEEIEPPETNEMNFLIFDIVQFEELDLIENNWDTRMDYVSKGCIEFRRMWKERNPELFENEDFRVSLKNQWPLNKLGKLENYIHDCVRHETDGIIFTPLSMKYIMGRCDEILKWKPIELNSSDFIALEKDGNYYLAIRITYLPTDKPPYADIPISILDSEPSSILDNFNGKIVECVYDVQTKGWKPLRVRTDKTTPNAYYTYVGIWKSIEDDITVDGLMRVFGNDTSEGYF